MLLPARDLLLPMSRFKRRSRLQKIGKPQLGILTMSSYHKSAIVTVSVGSGDHQQDFHLHQDLLEKNSEFFVSACHEWFMTGQTKSIELPDDKPEIFDAFPRHIYNDNELGCATIEENIEAYLLGEMLIAPSFKEKLYADIEYGLGWLDLGADVVIGLAEMVYARTLSADDGLRLTLATYFAAKSGKKNCTHCGLTECSHRPSPVFGVAARMMLAQCGNDEFVADVLGQYFAPYFPTLG